MKTIVTKLVHCPLRGWCSTEARSERTLSKRRRSKITCKHCTLPGQRKLPNSLLRGVCLCLWIIERCPPTFLIVAPIPAMFRLSRRNKKIRFSVFPFPFSTRESRVIFPRPDEIQFSIHPLTVDARSPRARSPRPRGSINSARGTIAVK